MLIVCLSPSLLDRVYLSVFWGFFVVVFLAGCLSFIFHLVQGILICFIYSCILCFWYHIWHLSSHSLNICWTQSTHIPVKSRFLVRWGSVGNAMSSRTQYFIVFIVYCVFLSVDSILNQAPLVVPRASYSNTIGVTKRLHPEVPAKVRRVRLNPLA